MRSQDHEEPRPDRRRRAGRPVDLEGAAEALRRVLQAQHPDQRIVVDVVEVDSDEWMRRAAAAVWGHEPDAGGS